LITFAKKPGNTFPAVQQRPSRVSGKGTRVAWR
jgi:hypothetical protein